MKKYCLLVSTILIVSVLCSCSADSKTEVKVETKVPETETAIISGVANPMVPYDTLQNLTMAADFFLLSPVAESIDYTLDKLYLIGGEIAEIDYTNNNNKNLKLKIRTARGSDDISGMYGESTEATYSDRTVKMYNIDNSIACSFTNENMTYSVSMENGSKEEFDSIMDYIFTEWDNIS